MASADPARTPVLVVDLDGTLCRTDTLHEALLALVSQRPGQLLSAVGWLLQGRAGFKARLADHLVVSGSALPLNPVVLDEVRAARAAGRRTALVSAADARQVAAVAAAVGLFDEVWGSTPDHNLKGSAKARFLTERYGARGFDYIGDHRADLSVWSAAAGAITVGAGDALRRKASAVNPEIRHLDPPRNRARAMVRALRPHQWSKNVLLFVPALAAHDASVLPQVFWGFLAFCFTASAVYVINDLLDLDSDRAHPRKCRRPFASGELTAATGLTMAAGLIVLALILALALGPPLFLGVLSLYFIATFAYSFWLKRKLLVDVFMLAGLYTVRIIAGAAAAGIMVSPWLLGFSMFIFCALASVKRQAELTDQKATGRESSGRAYKVDDLPILRGMSLSTGTVAVLVLALYIASDAVQPHYTRPLMLWLLCPLVLYWILRMIMETHRGNMNDDPIVYAATDRISLIVVGLCVGLLLAAI